MVRQKWLGVETAGAPAMSCKHVKGGVTLASAGLTAAEFRWELLFGSSYLLPSGLVSCFTESMLDAFPLPACRKGSRSLGSSYCSLPQQGQREKPQSRGQKVG